MPTSPAVWIVLISCVAVITALIVWKGRGAVFQRGDLTIKVDKSRAAQGPITVAKDIYSEGSEIGNIKGVSSTGLQESIPTTHVDVASNATFIHTKVGDITGVEVSGQQRARGDGDGDGK